MGPYCRAKQMLCDVIVLEQQRASDDISSDCKRHRVPENSPNFSMGCWLSVALALWGYTTSEHFCLGRLTQINLIPHKLQLCHENCPVRSNSYWWMVMYILGSVLWHRYPAEALHCTTAVPIFQNRLCVLNRYCKYAKLRGLGCRSFPSGISWLLQMSYDRSGYWKLCKPC